VVIPAEEDTGQLSLSGEEFRQLVRTARRLERFTPLSCVRSLQFADDAESGLYHCCAGGSLLILLADGTLMPCRRLPDVIGNIFDGELKDTLQNSETMRALRDAPIPAACAGCAHAERCRGGAKCITCAKTGSWEDRDPDCWH
jgi:radical SAM protein with 4Fe4S-binding SPASM domain